MKDRLKAAAVCIILAVPLLYVTLAAQQQKQASPAPIPAQILAAKKIFIANAGGEEPASEEPLFSGGVERAYNQFYAAMKTWGRYEIVSAPADADLLFEIRFTAPGVNKQAVRGEPVLFPAPYDPQFRLVIRDAKTSALLWAFTEHVEWAILKGNRDKNFDSAVAKIMNDVHKLSTPSATAPAK